MVIQVTDTYGPWLVYLSVVSSVVSILESCVGINVIHRALQYYPKIVEGEDGKPSKSATLVRLLSLFIPDW